MQYKEDMQEYEDHKKIFHQRINKLFVESGLRPKEFAEYIGIATPTLRSILNNPRIPSGYTVLKICKYFDVESDWLLGLMDV